MKLVAYTLNPDGTVPDFVIDGGYFADPRLGDSPQDWTLVGWVDDAETSGDEITDLKTYLTGIGAESWTDHNGDPVDLDHMVLAFMSVT